MIGVGRLFKSRSTRLIGWLLALSPAVVLLIFFLASWSWPPDLSTPVSDFLVEYPIPDEDGKAFNIVAQNPGQVWFTLPTANAIGSLVVTSTVDYRFDLYAIPTATSNPYDLVFDQARNVLWFTEHDANKLAYFDPASTIFTEYPITTNNSAPTGIDLSPDGKVWFVEQDANQLASFDPDSELFQEFLYPVPNGALEDVAVSNPNSIWFTAPGVERVVRYVPDSDDFLSIPVNSGPGTDPFAAHKIVIGSNGHPWVTAPDMDKIGLLVPGTLTLWRWYNLPVANANVAGLAYSWEEELHHL